MNYKMVIMSVVCCLISVIVACNGAEKQPVEKKQPVAKSAEVVFTRFDNKRNEQVQFIDQFGETQLLEFGKMDTIRIPVQSFLCVMELKKGNKISVSRFYPGDSITIKRDKISKDVIYVANNSVRNNELLYNSLNNGFLQVNKVLPAKVSSAIDDADRQAKIEISTLNQYAKNNRVSERFFNDEKNNILYKLNAAKAEITLQKAGLQEEDVNQFKGTLNVAENIELVSYKVFLYYYLECVKRLNKSSPVSKSFQFLTKNITGVSKDLLLFMLIKKLPPTYGMIKADSLVNAYSIIASNKVLKDYLLKNNELAHAKFLGNSTDLVIDDLNKTLTFSEVIQKYASKVVYVDIWASWCVPCRAEMPFSKKLANDLKDNTKIKFLYLSMDSNKAAWENAEKELLLTHNESYLMVNNFKSGFSKKMQIKDIPRYVLINKSGQIIATDAPRPSDPKLKQLLLDLSSK